MITEERKAELREIIKRSKPGELVELAIDEYAFVIDEASRTARIPQTPPIERIATALERIAASIERGARRIENAKDNTPKEGKS